MSALSRTFLLNNWLRKSWKKSAGPEPESDPNSWLITRSVLSLGVALTLYGRVWEGNCVLKLKDSINRQAPLRGSTAQLLMFINLPASLWFVLHHKQSQKKKEGTFSHLLPQQKLPLPGEITVSHIQNLAGNWESLVLFLAAISIHGAEQVTSFFAAFTSPFHSVLFWSLYLSGPKLSLPSSVLLAT